MKIFQIVLVLHNSITCVVIFNNIQECWVGLAQWFDAQSWRPKMVLGIITGKWYKSTGDNEATPDETHESFKVRNTGY